MSLMITVRTDPVSDSSHEELRLELEQATNLKWTLSRPDSTGTLGNQTYIIATIVGGAIGGAAEEMTKQLIEVVRTRLEEWRNQFIDRPHGEVRIVDTETDTGIEAAVESEPNAGLKASAADGGPGDEPAESGH